VMYSPSNALPKLFMFVQGIPKKGHFEIIIPNNEIKDAFENLARLKGSKTKKVDSIILHAPLVLHMKFSQRRCTKAVKNSVHAKESKGILKKMEKFILMKIQNRVMEFYDSEVFKAVNHVGLQQQISCRVQCPRLKERIVYHIL
jgi:hypothetical protein